MRPRQWLCDWPEITRLTLTELIKKKISTAVQRNVVVGLSQSKAARSRNRVQYASSRPCTRVTTEFNMLLLLRIRKDDTAK